MLQSISSPRAEGASPVLPPQLHAKKAVTCPDLMLHVVLRTSFAETLVAVKVAANEAELGSSNGSG
jgi:hypothetical protein